MASAGPAHLISVVKYNKYALRGVLGFYARGGHILYAPILAAAVATIGALFAFQASGGEAGRGMTRGGLGVLVP